MSFPHQFHCYSSIQDNFRARSTAGAWEIVHTWCPIHVRSGTIQWCMGLGFQDFCFWSLPGFSVLAGLSPERCVFQRTLFSKLFVRKPVVWYSHLQGHTCAWAFSTAPDPCWTSHKSLLNLCGTIPLIWLFYVDGGLKAGFPIWKTVSLFSSCSWLHLAAGALCHGEHAFLLHPTKLSHLLEFLCRVIYFLRDSISVGISTKTNVHQVW